MLIAHVESPNRGEQGDSVYRTTQPCRALAQTPGVTALSGSVVCPEMWPAMAGADILIVCDVVEPDLLPLLATRRQQGKFTVYEINDDFLSPQAWSPTAYLAHDLVSRSMSSQLAHLSDAVQFSVRELDRRFAHLNPRRAVFNNNLWEMPPQAKKPPGLRIGWGGSLGHLEDIKNIVPVLRRALARHPEATLAIMGAPSLHALFKDLPAKQMDLVPHGSLAEYYKFLATLHIGIAPLLPTDFNRCRSDVKFLEYGAHGAVPVCADLEPYRDTARGGETALLYKTHDELEALLERVLGDGDLRKRIAGQAYHYVRTQRIEAGRISDRWDFYRASGWSNEPSSGENQYSSCARGPVADLLYQGLVALRNADAGEARRCFAAASHHNPTFYRSFLYLGSVEPDTGAAMEALSTAHKLNPLSVSALLLLAKRLQASGDLPRARNILQQCTALAPSLGVAQGREGELVEAAGDWTGACLLYEAAWQANGFYTQPILRLALRALDEKRPGDAAALLTKSLANDDRLWTSHYLLGRALLGMGQGAQAKRHLNIALDRAEDPAPVLAQLAKAELHLGNINAARAVLARIKTLTSPG